MRRSIFVVAVAALAVAGGLWAQTMSPASSGVVPVVSRTPGAYGLDLVHQCLHHPGDGKRASDRHHDRPPQPHREPSGRGHGARRRRLGRGARRRHGGRDRGGRQLRDELVVDPAGNAVDPHLHQRGQRLLRPGHHVGARRQRLSDRRHGDLPGADGRRQPPGQRRHRQRRAVDADLHCPGARQQRSRGFFLGRGGWRVRHRAAAHQRRHGRCRIREHAL